MTRRVIQFGTSRFLQAHADLFLHEARAAGQDVGPVAVVQTSGASARAGRVAAFGAPGGYPVIIRGIEGGAPVERQVTVTSIDRGLSAATDWDAVTALFVEEAEIVLSNTGDTGYALAEADRGPALIEARPPASFPAKLTQLLYRRWQAGGRSLTLLPCELVNRNGRVLQGLVLDLAAEAGLPEDFRVWLRAGVIWTDTLVDRIVSEPIEPIGAVAEPYALWAIERRPGLTLPCEHPCIVLADDLEPFERLKLHILNLGHTYLAEIWQREGRPDAETVREILADPAVRARLDALYRDEVVPGFSARGMEAEANTYVAATLDRFRNPSLNHRIADIAQNHVQKVERRVHAFLTWVEEAGARLPAPVLRALAAAYPPGAA
ncbi:mannitol dehydrogenase family protein [Methylobacterium nonmethylotrophicum]|uniref:Mannitol dehydrogenase family protein n=1 Tax=Methylobacterium nonmethylotrophicum TaxID=1141884 RepID=A0A4Z0NRG5_9HYPH|nr:mannitol dehydrogenase family protein [Methylobacterium nonmethylotrophicum]TGD98803.1 mannitol dehydrogenase family protein [Methylobacterium nonmethylotrophicum]